MSGNPEMPPAEGGSAAPDDGPPKRSRHRPDTQRLKTG